MLTEDKKKKDILSRLSINQREHLLKMHRSECRDQIECNCYELNKKDSLNTIYEPTGFIIPKKLSLFVRIKHKIFAAISYIIPILYFKQFRKGYFLKVIFPIIPRTFPDLLANQIVSVQPMNKTVSNMFYIEYIKKSESLSEDINEKKSNKSCF